MTDQLYLPLHKDDADMEVGSCWASDESFCSMDESCSSEDYFDGYIIVMDEGDSEAANKITAAPSLCGRSTGINPVAAV